MEAQVFVLGDRDAVLGFALVGVSGLATDDPEAALAALAELRRNGAAGLVLVSAELARRLGGRLDEFVAAADLPIVYEIPSRAGRPPRAPAAELVRQALGVSA